MTMHFQQLRGCKVLNGVYMKGVPFVNRRYTKGVPFSGILGFFLEFSGNSNLKPNCSLHQSNTVMSVIFPYDFYKPPALTELEPTSFEKSGFHSNVIYFDRKNDYG